MGCNQLTNHNFVNTFNQLMHSFDRNSPLCVLGDLIVFGQPSLTKQVDKSVRVLPNEMMTKSYDAEKDVFMPFSRMSTPRKKELASILKASCHHGCCYHHTVVVTMLLLSPWLLLSPCCCCRHGCSIQYFFEIQTKLGPKVLFVIWFLFKPNL